MSDYDPTEWVDETPQTTPVKYTIKKGGETLYSDVEIEVETTVIPGTPLSAVNLNHIEQGIAGVDDRLGNTAPEIFTTKGDLIVGTSAGAGTRLGVGSNGQQLQADSAQPLGVKWVSPINFGGPWTNPSWISVAKPVGSYLITANSFNNNVPNSAKMIYMTFDAMWALANSEYGIYAVDTISLSICFGVQALVANKSLYAGGWVPLNSNGQFRIDVVGAATLFTMVRILGYML